MRSKDPVLMEEIKLFAEQYMIANGKSPSTSKIGEKFGIAKGTAYKYLIEMRNLNMIRYENGVISTPITEKCNTKHSTAALVGEILCGTPQEETEEVEEFINLPNSLFGEGPFYLLRAKGDSMIEAGINSGDLLVIKQQNFAKDGDIVVALTPENENTLKRFYQDKKNHKIILHPENSFLDDMTFDSVKIQGVLKNVIKFY